MSLCTKDNRENPGLQGLMPLFDLTLGLMMMGRLTNVVHLSSIEPCGEITGDIIRLITHRLAPFGT
jgi:hypothetical protein